MLSGFIGGCGGASGLLDSNYSGKTYTGSFAITGTNPQTTTGTVSFTKNDVSGTWSDSGTTRTVSGSSSGSAVTLILTFATGTYTFTNTTSVNGSGHIVGTLNGVAGGTLAIDLTPNP